MSVTLSDAALRAALQAWHLPELLEIRRIPSGLPSDVWYIEAAGARFVAKYAYQAQENFEDGLRAAELAERYGQANARSFLSSVRNLSVCSQLCDEPQYPHPKTHQV